MLFLLFIVCCSGNSAKQKRNVNGGSVNLIGQDGSRSDDQAKPVSNDDKVFDALENPDSGIESDADDSGSEADEIKSGSENGDSSPEDGDKDSSKDDPFVVANKAMSDDVKNELFDMINTSGAVEGDIIKFIKNNGDGYNLNSMIDKSNQQQTILHCAVTSDLKEVVGFLLSNGANIYLVNKKQRTAFDKAVTSNNLEMVEMFLDNNFDVNNVCESDGHTAIYTICKNNKLDVLKLVVNKLGATKVNIDNVLNMTLSKKIKAQLREIKSQQANN